MTVEYVLLLVAVFAIGLKTFTTAPKQAFGKAGPALGARIEKQLTTGDGFKPISGNSRLEWEKPE